MNTDTTTRTRRAILGGAAALATGAVANVAVITATRSAPAGVSLDPIFAAIEAHRAAFVRYHASLFVQSELHDGTPEHDRAKAENRDAFERMGDAGLSLVKTNATTMAGVLALLQYVDDFATQKIVPDNLDPRNWHSRLESLIGYASHDDQDRYSGEDLELPFLFWVVRNVSNALTSMKLAAA